MRDIVRADPRTLTSGLLTAEQAAAWLNISRAQFYKLGLRKIIVSQRCHRYDIKDLQFYADTHGTIEPLRKTG